jgi:hypothetical protein
MKKGSRKVIGKKYKARQERQADVQEAIKKAHERIVGSLTRRDVIQGAARRMKAKNKSLSDDNNS